MPVNIKGQTAIVTGAASGLGAATARYLAAQGARLAVLDFNADKARAVADALGGHALPCDVGDYASVQFAMGQAEAHLGPPRIVVNCAGIASAARIVGRDGADSVALFRKVIEVNLLGTYHVMTCAVQSMSALDPLVDGERGVIVNTASAAYEDGQVGQTAYAASKGAVASMCLPAARELARVGIRVVAIAPGLFETPMMQALPQDVTDKITANIPFPHRLGDPAEFGRLVGDIVGNAYLNGTVIRLDGAVRLPPK